MTVVIGKSMLECDAIIGMAIVDLIQKGLPFAKNDTLKLYGNEIVTQLNEQFRRECSNEE